jgi:DNA-binding MarR family transcriptional regulator
MFELPSYLPYLLNRAGTRLASAFTRELKSFGIGLNRWRILAALHQGGDRRMGELAQMTSIESSTLTRAVDALEAAKLARRVRTSEDLRGVSVRLTPRGWALTEAIIPIAVRYERVALANLDPEEEALLKRLLIRVYDNMAALEEAAASSSEGDGDENAAA